MLRLLKPPELGPQNLMTPPWDLWLRDLLADGLTSPVLSRPRQSLLSDRLRYYLEKYGTHFFGTGAQTELTELRQSFARASPELRQSFARASPSQRALWAEMLRSLAEGLGGPSRARHRLSSSSSTEKIPIFPAQQADSSRVILHAKGWLHWAHSRELASPIQRLQGHVLMWKDARNKCNCAFPGCKQSRAVKVQLQLLSQGVLLGLKPTNNVDPCHP